MSATIYDIAEASGVSIATVSRVLNKNAKVNFKTREKVLNIATKLGYQPKAFARGLANKKTSIITVLVPVISNYFFMEILAGIQEKLGESDYDVTIFNVRSDRDVIEQIEYTIKKGLADGYMFISIHLSDKQWEYVHSLNAPCVLVDEYFSKFDSVSIDSIEGAYIATNYLLEQGHDRVAIISAALRSKPIKDRVQGYRRALEDSGRMIAPDLMVFSTDPARDGFTEKSGYESMVELIQRKNRVDACFVTSDIQAIGALKAMTDHGVHLPIVSFDDIEIASYCGLTTMRQPMREIGELAFERILHRLKTPHSEISHTVFSPTLVVRKSTELLPKSI